MHVTVSRQHRDLVTRHRLLLDLSGVEDELRANRAASRREQSLRQAKEFYAAARISALVRGFLARLGYRTRLLHSRSALVLQRLVRGWLGRLRWKSEYWRTVSVVGSRGALQEMLKRSRLVREEVRRRGGDSSGFRWKELFDPLTESFWYFNGLTGESSWTCPLAMQSGLVCRWEGFAEFGGLPCQDRCRCLFDSLRAYHNHLTREHRWYCPACSHRNPGLAFPTCVMCGNQRGGGEGGLFSAVSALQTSTANIKRRLHSFLTKDEAWSKDFIRGYKIKDRLVHLALRYREQILQQARDAGESTWDLVLAVRFGESADGPSTDPVVSKRGEAYLNMCYAKRALDPLTALETLVTVPMTDIRQGIIPAEAVEAMLQGERVPTSRPRPGETFKESDYGTEILPEGGIFVCSAFSEGLCSLTTCPLAHPGLRDKAKIQYHTPKTPGLRKRPFVRICQDALSGSCSADHLCCPLYHIYIRPSTIEIIRRIYPVKIGETLKLMPSGAVEYRGHISNSGFNGYGTMNWKNKAVYMGYWENNKRHGFGIYRTVTGVEYYGSWRQGMRDGPGYLCLNGDDERYIHTR